MAWLPDFSHCFGQLDFPMVDQIINESLKLRCVGTWPLQLNKPIGLIKIILFGNSFPGQMWGNEHPMQLLSKSCILSEENDKKYIYKRKEGGGRKK